MPSESVPSVSSSSFILTIKEGGFIPRAETICFEKHGRFSCEDGDNNNKYVRFFGLHYLRCDMNHCEVNTRWFVLKLEQSGGARVTRGAHACFWRHHGVSCNMDEHYRCSFQSCSPIWCCTAAELLGESMGTGEEYYDETLPSLWKIILIYQAMQGVASRTSSTKVSLFRIILKHLSHKLV